MPVPAPLRRHPWWALTVAIVLLSAALVRWTGTRPSYDAYGWLVWGYQTLHLSLDLGGAPSWKPLPYLFTVPYALFGHLELALWMVTAVALSLAGSVLAGRIAYRVVAADAPGGNRRAAWVGAIFAGGAVLAIQEYPHYILSVQSDPVIVTGVLAGIDCHLGGRMRLAFALGVLAGLGRPEAWCLLGPYTLYLWLRVPATRRLLVVGWAFVLFMWFGVPTITNGRPFVSAQLAQDSPRKLTHGVIAGTLGRFTQLHYLPIWLATLGTVAWAAVRQHGIVLCLAAGAAVWVITEVAFALHGWPGLPRYMFEAGALCAVVAGIGAGWLLASPLRLGARPGPRPGGREPRRAGGPDPRLGGRELPRPAGPVLAAVLVLALLPAARGRFDHESSDLAHERARAGQIELLRRTFAALGGPARIRHCGQPTIEVEFVSSLAYYLHMDVGFVEYRLAHARRHHRPLVIFLPVRDGWKVQPLHVRRSRRADCRPLHSEFVLRPGHPAGVAIAL